MQKILSILFTAYKNYVVYIPDIIWVNIILIIRLLVIITLYKYLYKNYSENDLIMWYSLIQVTYAVIITQVVVTSKPKINMEISNDVKSWKI
jgi:C4-dicarboxylate transporter